MDKIICALMEPNFEVLTETKINHQLIENQTKMKLYLLDIHTNTVRGSVRTIGTSRIKDIVAINAFLFLSKLCFVDLGCKCRCNSSCSFVTTESQRWLKRKLLIFSLKGKSSKVLWLSSIHSTLINYSS